MWDRDATGVPSIFKVIRSVEVVTRMLSILDLRCEENTTSLVELVMVMLCKLNS